MCMPHTYLQQILKEAGAQNWEVIFSPGKYIDSEQKITLIVQSLLKEANYIGHPSARHSLSSYDIVSDNWVAELNDIVSDGWAKSSQKHLSQPPGKVLNIVEHNDREALIVAPRLSSGFLGRKMSHAFLTLPPLDKPMQYIHICTSKEAVNMYIHKCTVHLPPF